MARKNRPQPPEDAAPVTPASPLEPTDEAPGPIIPLEVPHLEFGPDPLAIPDMSGITIPAGGDVDPIPMLEPAPLPDPSADADSTGIDSPPGLLFAPLNDVEPVALPVAEPVLGADLPPADPAPSTDSLDAATLDGPALPQPPAALPVAPSAPDMDAAAFTARTEAEPPSLFYPPLDAEQEPSLLADTQPMPPVSDLELPPFSDPLTPPPDLTPAPQVVPDTEPEDSPTQVLAPVAAVPRRRGRRTQVLVASLAVLAVAGAGAIGWASGQKSGLGNKSLNDLNASTNQVSLLLSQRGTETRTLLEKSETLYKASDGIAGKDARAILLGTITAVKQSLDTATILPVTGNAQTAHDAQAAFTLVSKQADAMSDSQAALLAAYSSVAQQLKDAHDAATAQADLALTQAQRVATPTDELTAAVTDLKARMEEAKASADLSTTDWGAYAKQIGAVTTSAATVLNTVKAAGDKPASDQPAVPVPPAQTQPNSQPAATPSGEPTPARTATPSAAPEPSDEATDARTEPVSPQPTTVPQPATTPKPVIIPQPVTPGQEPLTQPAAENQMPTQDTGTASKPVPAATAAADASWGPATVELTLYETRAQAGLTTLAASTLVCTPLDMITLKPGEFVKNPAQYGDSAAFVVTGDPASVKVAVSYCPS